MRKITENFEYDGLNRLTSYGGNTVWYADNGNISAKSDAGIFVYTESAKPYALTGAVFTDTSLPTRDQSVAYSSFARPLTLSENYNDVTFDYGPDFNRVKMQRDYKSAWNLKRFYLGGNYEFDAVSNMPTAVKDDPVPVEPFLPETYGTNGGITIAPEIGGEVAKQELFYDVERIYLGGDAYTAPAVLVNSTSGKGSQTLYYIVRDHLGSIVALVDSEDGKVLEENSYDAWGRMRNPDTHTLYDIDKTPKLILSRGYGGHEYLPNLGLVNMNARLYDPILGRFLSPDPYVQDPGNPQNFNRYSYCLNNPLLYKDPYGEFFLIDDFLIGSIKGFFDAVFHGKNILKTTWNSGTLHLNNNLNLWKGLFSTDSNKNFWGRAGELLSRFTWQLTQTAFGFIVSEYYNIYGDVTDVQSKYGATVIRTRNFDRAFTLGNFIVGDQGIKANSDNPKFQHEYGHYRQSQLLGPLYVDIIAIPSLISATTGKHEEHWMEKDASTRAFNYFMGNGLSYKWSITHHPIYPSTLHYWQKKLGYKLYLY